jgi:putative methyltransferase (TIGR04325 family)
MGESGGGREQLMADGRRRLDAACARFLPPFAYRWVAGTLQDYGYSGDYASWDEARSSSTGYDTDLILTKVRDALLKVKRGEARAERDSILFDHIEYSFPVLAALLRVALENSATLSVLDFGGSLGSTYFQVREFLPPLQRLEWSIVEQPRFVACGKQEFENEELAFFDSIDHCLEKRRPQVLLLSGVLSYLPDPYLFLADLPRHAFSTVVVDITPFFETTSRLVVQRVPAEVYPASYPAWILSRARFLRAMDSHYQAIAEFESMGTPSLHRLKGRMLGFIFVAKALGPLVSAPTSAH